MRGVLEGVKVIELGHWVAVPSACAVLVDWGCEVIKIEDPRRGDPVRNYRSVENIEVGEVNIWFEQMNRGKKSVAVDLSKERGREVVYRMVGDADVFISNFQAHVLKRLGMDYSTLSVINPRLIYVTLSGYGDTGPDKDKPGYDHVAFWARSGVMDRLGGPHPPPLQRPAFGDNIAALALAGVVSAALFARERTGAGQEIHTSLYALGVWALSWDILVALNLGKEIDRIDRRKVRNPLRNIYRTKDGKWMYIIVPDVSRFWDRFCEAIGREDLKGELGVKDNITLVSVIEEALAGKTYKEWEEIFNREGIVFGAVQSPLDVVNDPQAWENRFFTEISEPSHVKMVASPFKFGKSQIRAPSRAPGLGEHTEEILLSLGYTKEDIDKLRGEGVIR